MNPDKSKIIVYYDFACPKCVKDRRAYEKLAGKAGVNVCWTDITGQEARLREIGIDPKKASTELHVLDEQQLILSEMDAYILLMSKVPLLKSLAWLIGLPPIRPLLAILYHWQVTRRLRLRGML
jgi:predicted DCC family thiol-disulfide oxidoreductase YuxK